MTATTGNAIQPRDRSPISRFWPLVGSAVGLLGATATLFTDIHVSSDGEGETVGVASIANISQRAAYIGTVTGFVAVALLIVLAAIWRQRVESAYPGSTAARVASQGMVAAAGALMLGYGWKGSLAIYLPGGMDEGTYDQTGLFVYYMLNDFGTYIGWFGITVAAGAIAWMSLRERHLPIWLGLWSCLPVIAVILFTGITGLPGFPGVVSPIWMTVAFAGLAFHWRTSFATRPASPATDMHIAAPAAN